MKLTLLSGFEFDTSNVFRIYFNGDLQTADVLDLNGEPLCTIRGSHEYENLRSLCEGDFDDLRRKAWEIIKVTVVDDAKYRSSAEFGRGNSPSRPSVKPKKKPAKKGAKRRR